MGQVEPPPSSSEEHAFPAERWRATPASSRCAAHGALLLVSSTKGS